MAVSRFGGGHERRHDSALSLHADTCFFAPLVNESITPLVRTLLALRRRRRVGQNGERGKRRRCGAQWPRCDDQLLRVAHLERERARIVDGFSNRDILFFMTSGIFTPAPLLDRISSPRFPTRILVSYICTCG